MAGLDKFLKSAKKIQEERKQTRSPDGPRPATGHDEGNWLMSYADMMTLLCGFFILLFSMAKLDQPKYEKMKEELSKEFHGQYVNQPQQMADHFTHALQEINVQKGVVVKPDATGVSIVFESTLFFDTLSANVRPEGREVLAHLINSVGELQKKDSAKFRIVVEGHTDSRPITAGFFPSNWELSSSRAASVVRMFIDRGFDADRLAAVGYADTHPVAPSRGPNGAWDDAALAKNRRVVVRILEPKIDSIPIPSNEGTEVAAVTPAEKPAVGPAPAKPAAAITAAKPVEVVAAKPAAAPAKPTEVAAKPTAVPAKPTEVAVTKPPVVPAARTAPVNNAAPVAIAAPAAVSAPVPVAAVVPAKPADTAPAVESPPVHIDLPKVAPAAISARAPATPAAIQGPTPASVPAKPDAQVPAKQDTVSVPVTVTVPVSVPVTTH